MFKVDASSLNEYFDLDPDRKHHLLSIDKLIRKNAPNLKRWFYKGSQPGEPGMRMKLIGYGSFDYSVKSGQKVKWPVIGLALQKHYISLYLAVTKNDQPILAEYRNQLGALRYGSNNFSFTDPNQLDLSAFSSLLQAIDQTVMIDPGNALVYSRSQSK